MLPAPIAIKKKKRSQESYYANHQQQHQIFVSGFVASDFRGAAAEVPIYTAKQEQKRATRWKEVRYIHNCIKAQGRLVSVEKALWANSQITCREFVIVMIGAFRFDAVPGIDVHLRRLYK